MIESPFDFANLSNRTFIEEVYNSYLEDPQSVDTTWQCFFEGIHFAESLSVSGGPLPQGHAQSEAPLIDQFRKYGHLGASVSYLIKTEVPEVLQKHAGSDAFASLAALYMGTIGYEFDHVEDEAVKQFIIDAIEKGGPQSITKEEKLEIFDYMTRAESFESFIHRNYQGHKRFSLEGGEAFIPMMHCIKAEGARSGVEDLVVALAHRGRLNTLAHIFEKPYEDLFFEFEPVYQPPFQHVSGDVKYHLGYESTHDGMHMYMMPNPSHLESVNAPCEGYARAMQDAKGGAREKVLPVVVHGDAAIAGQGIVYEVLQMCHLEGYQTGGTIHIVINNHIGFTAEDKDTRSTRYCTDIAKAFSAPVFHVNGDDPVGCYFVTKLAVALRQTFQQEVFIELDCYRKYGHNESDEPNFTNPLIYQKLAERENPQVQFRKQLLNSGICTEDELVAIETAQKQKLEEALAKTKQKAESYVVEEGQEQQHQSNPVETKLDPETVKKLGDILATPPDGFSMHQKVERIIGERKQMAYGEKPADWGFAENLAYASLLAAGTNIRISGEDVKRGTFAHRHAVFFNQQDGSEYAPLSQFDAHFSIYNSHLSEYGVLGFEFGYSVQNPNNLVVWEAQYGDFANGAQIVWDQYISSSEQKWNQKSALTLLLPHGYEGGGPEHSSARIERYLQLAANDNVYIVMPSTPAQVFHALRRQGLQEHKRPLVMCMPKALLRFPPSLSELSQITDGQFEPVLTDPTPPQDCNRVILCCGKVYYELMPHRDKMPHTAIHRIEQLYPLDIEKIKSLIGENVKELLWVQEEHQNMGAFEYIYPLLLSNVSDSVKIRYVGRKKSASTAAGSMALHNKELEQLLNEAFE